MVDKLKIEMVELAKIKQYGNNAKLHPESQIKQIAKSIEEFGFNDPIAIDENNTIIEGHGRYLAAMLLKMDKIPAIKLSHLSEAKRKAYILIHNNLTMITGFDENLIQQQINEICDSDLDFEMSDFGFLQKEIETINETNSESRGAFSLDEPDFFKEKDEKQKITIVIEKRDLSKLKAKLDLILKDMPNAKYYL